MPPARAASARSMKLHRALRWGVALLDELPIILLVEDEAVLQNLVRHALSDAGFDLTVSSSAEEALSLLTSKVVRYRALVTDIKIDGELNG
jgi:CheY-like chemotaxis protein